MPNVMVALPNIGGALCSTPQSLADAHYQSAVQYAAKMRKLFKLVGAPQTRKQISAISSPKFAILWGHAEEVSLLNKFFPIVDTCLSYEDTARQDCATVPNGDFLRLVFSASSTFQTCILNSH